jgi:tetratricopeptide (TPR) repeat protein
MVSRRFFSLPVSLLAALPVVALVSCKEDPAETHHRAAVELYSKGDFAKAAAEYDEVFKLNPKLDEKIQKKGAQAWAKAGQFEQAAAILQRLASQKEGPEKLAAFKELAGFYMSTANDLDEAEHWYAKILELSPQDAEATSWLAEIAAIRGGARSAAKVAEPEMLDLALSRYDKVIALKPEDPAPHVNKRIVYIKYLDYLEKQRVASLADAETNKADKEVAGDFMNKAEELKGRHETMKGQLDEVTKRIGELNRAAKEAKK